MHRKIIQIATAAWEGEGSDGGRWNHTYLIALCDDGSMWRNRDFEMSIALYLWERLPDVPQPEVSNG